VNLNVHSIDNPPFRGQNEDVTVIKQTAKEVLNMPKLRKTLAYLIAAVVLMGAGLIAAAEVHPEGGAVRIGSLKGPTTMGLVKLMADADAGEALNDYDFTLAGTPDEIVPLLVRGELDIALIPANLASILYNNTDGAVTVAAVCLLGTLYILEDGEEIHSIEDLRGRTIFSTGRGTTPEFALNYILGQNGIDPMGDLNIEYKSEATEVAAAFAAEIISIGVLPQPYVTAVLAQNEKLRIALSLSDEWDKVGFGSALVTGVVLARNDFMEKRPGAMAAFMREFAASVEYVNENPGEAGEWIAALGIVANAQLAANAIPYCNIVCITGEEMVVKLSGYLEALYAQNPAAVGGALPNDGFFFYLP